MATELDYAGAAGLDVLDVGCGQGIDLARYALAGAEPTGIDLTPDTLRSPVPTWRRSGWRGRSMLGDAERLSFDEASFDRVSSNGVLHHTPEIAGALREINRVLKPGGRATIIVYNRNSLHYWLHQVAVHGVLLRRDRPPAWHGRGALGQRRAFEYRRPAAGPRLSARELASICAEAGFESVEIRVRHYRAGTPC